MDKNISTIYKTADGKQICVEVSTAVKELLEQSNRQICSQRRQDRRHLYREEYIDGITDTTIIYPQEDFADLVTRKDMQKQLNYAMQKLSSIQRQRLYLYYFKGLSFREIGKIEGVNHRSVARSVEQAIKKLHNIISD